MDYALKIAKKEDYNTGRNVRRFHFLINVYATGQDTRFVKEYAYKQCYLLRRAWKNEEAEIQINDLLRMLLKYGVIEKVKKDGLKRQIPHVISYIILGYAAVKPSWYSVKRRGQYVEAIREALKKAIRLEPKWDFDF